MHDVADHPRAFTHPVRTRRIHRTFRNQLLGLLRQLRERRFDLAGSLRRLRRQVFHLGRDHGETLAGFAGARRFDCGIQREQMRLTRDQRDFLGHAAHVRERRAQRAVLALDHGYTLDEPVNVRQRRLQRLLRFLHAGRGLGADGAHLARGDGDPVVARHRLRRRFAQRPAHLRLMLHARRDFLDVPRHVADLDAQFARLRGDVADHRARTACPAKAEARH